MEKEIVVHLQKGAQSYRFRLPVDVAELVARKMLEEVERVRKEAPQDVEDQTVEGIDLGI